MLRRGSSKEFEDSAGNALLDAVNRGKVHLAKFILDVAGSEATSLVNYCDFRGKTPLIRAMYITDEKCRHKSMQLLLSRHANPNLQDDEGRTPLSYACERFLKDAIKLLIKSNADPNIPDKTGFYPLMYCAKVGNAVGLGILIKCFRRLGLNVDETSNEGYTALHIAAIHKNIECASRLTIDGYASVTKVDLQYGRTAEQWARCKGCRTPELALFSISSEKLQRPRHVSRNQRKSSANRISSKSKSKSLERNTGSNGELVPPNTIQINEREYKKKRKMKSTNQATICRSFSSNSDEEFNLQIAEESILSKSMSNMSTSVKPNSETPDDTLQSKSHIRKHHTSRKHNRGQKHHVA